MAGVLKRHLYGDCTSRLSHTWGSEEVETGASRRPVSAGDGVAEPDLVEPQRRRCWRPTSRPPRSSPSRAASSTPTRSIEKLSTVLPDIEVEQTYHKLKSGAGFVWLKRQLTPQAGSGDLRSSALPGHRLPHREAPLLSGPARPPRTSSGSPTSTTRASPASRNISTTRAWPTCRPPACHRQGPRSR